jgi:hypothetical protein
MMILREVPCAVGYTWRVSAPGTEQLGELELRALARAARSPSGIGVAVARRSTAGAVRCRVSDGRRFGWVDVDDPTVAVHDRLVDDLERFAARLPGQERLRRLQQDGPLPYPFA